MRQFAAAFLLLTLPTLVAAAGKQTPKREPDLCVVPPGAQPLLPAKLLPGMGETRNFAVTTASEDARRFFLQGVSQIHSFWFTEAERSCLQAADLDPQMAMAYWCIALSAAGDYRPAFQLMRDPNDGGRAGATRDTGDTVQRSTNGAAINPALRAREAIQKALSLRDGITPRERLYIESQAARRLTSDHDQAEEAYIHGLRKLVAAYPDDLDAKSMLGLALDNGFEPATKEPRAHTMEAIRLLEDVAARDDSHFGAHHYLIHAWEGSRTPERAWHACERYAALVTNIPHALHMPGHIYAQSDKVPEAIAAFTAAADNELTWMNADSLYSNGHHGHNVHFLIHALNLGGKYQDSIRQARHLLTLRETPRERSGNSQRIAWRQGYFGLIKTLVRFERWADILDGRTIPLYDRPEQNAWRRWATGLAYAATGDLERAKTTLADLEKDSDQATATREAIRIAAIELEAAIAGRGGDRGKAYGLFRKAATREANMPYTEPPSYPRPVVEGFANVALAVGDFATAEQEYRAALEREPGSGRALFGLAAALDGLGRTAEAADAQARAARAWANADPDLPQLQHLRASSAAR